MILSTIMYGFNNFWKVIKWSALIKGGLVSSILVLSMFIDFPNWRIAVVTIIYLAIHLFIYRIAAHMEDDAEINAHKYEAAGK
jgi:hypothetical protein